MDEELSSSQSQQSGSALNSAIEWVESIASALIVIILIFVFVARQATVDGESMENTFKDKDKVIVANLFCNPQKGNVIAFYAAKPLDKPLIKRVIATAGDKVNIDYEKGIVYVNDKPLSEPYTKEPTYRVGDMSFPLIVPSGMIFVMGDNRNNSDDSRFREVGLIDTDIVIGRVLARFYPFNQLKSF